MRARSRLANVVRSRMSSSSRNLYLDPFAPLLISRAITYPRLEGLSSSRAERVLQSRIGLCAVSGEWHRKELDRSRCSPGSNSGSSIQSHLLFEKNSGARERIERLSNITIVFLSY